MHRLSVMVALLVALFASPVQAQPGRMAPGTLPPLPAQLSSLRVRHERAVKETHENYVEAKEKFGTACEKALSDLHEALANRQIPGLDAQAVAERFKDEVIAQKQVELQLIPPPQQPNRRPVRHRPPWQADWNKSAQMIERACEKCQTKKLTHVRACEKALKELAEADQRYLVTFVERFKKEVIAAQQVMTPEVIVCPMFLDGIRLRGPHGHTYKLFEDNLPWEKAKKKCEQEGGHLLVINNAQEFEFIRTSLKFVLEPGNDQMWMGANKDEQGAWRWLDGVLVVQQHWRQNFPVPDAGKDFMVMVGNGEYVNLRGNNQPGTRFICEWE